MADRIAASQVIVQAEVFLTSRVVASQVVVQVEYELAESDAPTQEKLLRHGSWFSASGKERFWWAR